MNYETEAKIRVSDPEALRTRLLELGAADGASALERNWVLDDPEGSLERRGVLLRVRGHGADRNAGGGILTVKRAVSGGAFKTREEAESMVDSVDDLLRQFELLGYRVAWIYEKRRRTMIWRDCVLALDECPEIGCFVEIEGEEKNIREVCAAAGLDPALHIGDSYLGLWRKHLEERRETPRHMIFPADAPPNKGQTE